MPPKASPLTAEWIFSNNKWHILPQDVVMGCEKKIRRQRSILSAQQAAAAEAREIRNVIPWRVEIDLPECFTCFPSYSGLPSRFCLFLFLFLILGN